MATAGALLEAQTRDFSGGPNLRDAASKLAANEVVDSWNVVYDNRGGVSSRLGCTKYNSTVYDAAKVCHNGYWSPLLATAIVQCGAKLFKGTSNTVNKTFTTEATVTFAELNSLVFAAHPVDGIWSSPDGVTWTVLADADAPVAGVNCLATWQNKLYAGMADGSVRWSAATDGTAWTSTDFNKLWEKNQAAIVALHVGSGQDILGKPGLLAFKNDSFYRINDSATGAYVTIDATVGAAGPLAVTGVGARVVWICQRGIFWWREDQAQAVNASDQLLPVWDPGQVDFSRQNLWCAGRDGRRAIFSLTRSGSTANDLSLRFDPDQGWVSPGSDARSFYMTSVGATGQLYGGSPTVNGQVYALNSGGTDDGTAISGRLQTRWEELSADFLAQLWKVRLQGRGSGTMTVRKDYASGGGDLTAFDFTDPNQPHWDSIRWDDFNWGTPQFQGNADIASLGVCKQFSLLFQFTVSTTVTVGQVLGAGTAPAVGAFALAGLTWLYVPLGPA